MTIYTAIISECEKFKFSSLLIDGDYEMPSLTIKNGELEECIDNPQWLWQLYLRLGNGDLDNEYVKELEDSFLECKLDYKELDTNFLIVSSLLFKATEMKLLTTKQFI